jgi:hypothetical protein
MIGMPFHGTLEQCATPWAFDAVWRQLVTWLRGW